MSQEELLKLLELFESNSIDVVVDGGWGVDALVGKQTRDHNDLDIAVNKIDSVKLRALLEDNGFSEVPRNDSAEYMFVLGNAEGLQVDVHVYEFDDNRNTVYGIEYPYDSLQGTGEIAGKRVKCISPEYVVKFHSGYELKDKDYHDVKHICEKFNIELPAEYKGLST